MELIAAPYTLRIDLELSAGCNGTIVRLPDGVEANFNHSDGLLALLESMGGPRWWQANRDQVTKQVQDLQHALCVEH